MNINILTLFPSFFDSPLRCGLLGRAIAQKILKISFINPRNFTTDSYKSVDDSPFGGADGMLLRYDIMEKALKSISGFEKHSVYYLSPQGRKWDYKKVRAFSKKKSFTLICGRYAGLDARFITKYVDEEISIGDYVLNGGESAALVLLESIMRFIPGALGNRESSQQESFENQGLLEGPEWTRPRDIKGFKIPEVMLSGRHKNIKEFKYFLSLMATAKVQPDILKNKFYSEDLKKAFSSLSALSDEELKACGFTREFLNSVLS